MKKRNIFSIACLFLAVTLLTQSCGPPAHFFKEEPTVDKRDVTLRLVNFQVDWKFTFWCCLGLPRFKKAITGVKVEIQNNSDETVKVIWNESSVTYAGNSERVAYKHASYKNAGGTFPPLVIPPQGSSTKIIYPASSIAYEDGSWKINPMEGLEPGSRIKYSIRVEYENGEEEYYTLDEEAPLPDKPVWLWNQAKNCNLKES